MRSVTQSKLETARAQSSNNLTKIGAIALAVVAVVALFLLLSGTATPAQTETTSVDPCTTLTAAELSQQAISCPQRDEFIAALRHLQQDLGPQLATISLASWAPDRQREIDERQADAISAFEQSDYVTALDEVQQAIALATAQLNQAPELLEQHLTAMTQAFNAGELQAAQHAQFRAAQIDSSHPVLAEYGPRIAVLERVQQHQQRAAIARSENRPANELEELQAIVQLDPARQEHKSRIATIVSNLREQRFQLLVQQTETALSAGELNTAREHLARASREFPTRDFSSLAGRIDSAVAQRLLEKHLVDARIARSADDWSAANSHYAAVLGIDPANKEAVVGQQDAQRLLSAFTSLETHLQHPIRLATSRVATHVKGELVTLQAYRADSPRLAQLMTGIEDVLARASIPANVAVISDGNTQVEVRRVGIVGQHKRKVIQLTPGEYQLEGRRKGYKSKIVFLQVPLDVASVEVRVECNERI